MRSTRTRGTSGVRRSGVALAVVVLAGALTACGGAASDGAMSAKDASATDMSEKDMAEKDMAAPGTTAPGTGVEEPAPSEPMAPGAPAAELAVTGTTIAGEPLDLVAHLDGRPAVLWFWAPWCPVCAAEADEVAAQATASSGEVTFVGVAAHDGVTAMRDFVDRHGLEGFEHLADEDGAVWERFGVSAQPAYAFVSADGTVRVVPSSLGADDLAAEVARLTAG